MDSESRGSESSEEKQTGNGSSGGSGSGKRQRTSFTAGQVATLQEEFRRNPNPSPEDLERIADLTGHTRKVVMVSSRGGGGVEKFQSVEGYYDRESLKVDRYKRFKNTFLKT